MLRAMSYPILGQFDPEFTELMNETMEMLRDVFQTNNQWAYPIDGTSRSGIEAVLVSVIEPGDKVLVPIYGASAIYSSKFPSAAVQRLFCWRESGARCLSQRKSSKAIHREKPNMVAIVHGETSTGCIQPLDGIGAACRGVDALLVVDAVATIGGVPVKTDEWQLDAVIGGTQKCLSVPSGMSPITYNERVEAKVMRRKTIERGLREKGSAVSDGKPVASNYFDLGRLQDYWSPKRLNHHTEATSMLYALREGLRIVLQEGLESRYRRHRAS